MKDILVKVFTTLFGIIAYCFIWLLYAFAYSLPVLIVLKIIGII